MKNCREIVNYKDAEFHDPAITELWIEIINDINNSSFNQVLSKYIDKDKIEQYCSQATTAILAIATVRIRSVVNDIKNERIEVLSDEQKNWIKTIAQEYMDTEGISDLLI